MFRLQEDNESDRGYEGVPVVVGVARGVDAVADIKEER
jgi:hypothetical protein